MNGPAGVEPTTNGTAGHLLGVSEAVPDLLRLGREGAGPEPGHLGGADRAQAAAARAH